MRTKISTRSQVCQRTVRDLLDTHRDELVRLCDNGEISDEVMHAIAQELDLEDQRLEI